MNRFFICHSVILEINAPLDTMSFASFISGFISNLVGKVSCCPRSKAAIFMCELEDQRIVNIWTFFGDYIYAYMLV